MTNYAFKKADNGTYGVAFEAYIKQALDKKRQEKLEWVEFLKGNAEAFFRALMVVEAIIEIDIATEEKIKWDILIKSVDSHFDAVTIKIYE